MPKCLNSLFLNVFIRLWGFGVLGIMMFLPPYLNSSFQYVFILHANQDISAQLSTVKLETQ